jgi:hypothetical protein
MKITSIFLVLILAVAGSALAQTAPAPDTAATAAAAGSYPAGTLFNGVPISGLEIAAGAVVPSDGTAADGRLTVVLLGPALGVGKQEITVHVIVTGGSRPASNVATITGTATVDMGTGATPLAGVPVVATITTDANNQGSVGLVIGATTLPTAPIGTGTMTVEDLAQ